MMGNGGLLWNEGRGIGHHLELIWATLNYFTFLRLHKSPSTLLRVFLGILWYSVKQIKAPYMFDWEHTIALHTMQGNRASSLNEGEVSWFFSSCGRNRGYIPELWRGWPFKTRVCSATSGLLSSYDGHFRNLNSAWQDNTDTSGCEVEDRLSLSSWHSDIRIPINFQ